MLHAVVLGVVAASWVGHGGQADPRGHVGSLVAVDTADVPTLVDLAAIDTVLPAAVVPPQIAPPPPQPDLAAAPVGDRTNPVVEPRAHLENGGETLRAPASDRGTGAGRPLPDRAWRRDASTLHDRLTDGAEINQPSHAQTARAAASPQAVRRESKTGTGDAARTTEYVRSATAARYGVVDPADTGAGTKTMPGTGSEIAHSQSLATATLPQQNVASSTQGPLDADRGRRSFDVDGRANGEAADDRATRAASDENHPSITDLTLAAVSGNSAEGRGPSDTPGAVAAPTKGTAPTPVGRRNPSDGAGDEARTQERRYNRYVQEIGSRVNQALVWPRTLAIRLEQGETIVRFVILPDGKVGDTAQVVKSSGFAEFDQAALDAVHKASPFPPMREPGRARPLSVNLPVNFSNPVIR